jgi:hypothetical protein
MLTMVAIIHLIFPDSQRLQHKQSGQNSDGRHWNKRSNAHDDGSRLFWNLNPENIFLFLCTQSWGHFSNKRGRWCHLMEAFNQFGVIIPQSISNWPQFLIQCLPDFSAKAAGASAEGQSFHAADRRQPTTVCQQDAVSRDSRLLSSAAHWRMSCVVMMSDQVSHNGPWYKPAEGQMS